MQKEERKGRKVEAERGKGILDHGNYGRFFYALHPHIRPGMGAYISTKSIWNYILPKRWH